LSALERTVLIGPNSVARAAARFAVDPKERWMLRQPRDVRRSFYEHAFDRDEVCEQVWMLRQPREVRESFIEHVLLVLNPEAAEPVPERVRTGRRAPRGA
jgi:hypothetical protein